MEFDLQSKYGAFPCEVTLDEENGRYTVRNADTTGAFFNTPEELVQWLTQNWSKNHFIHPEEYDTMILQLNQYLQNPTS